MFSPYHIIFEKSSKLTLLHHYKWINRFEEFNILIESIFVFLTTLCLYLDFR